MLKAQPPETCRNIWSLYITLATNLYIMPTHFFKIQRFRYQHGTLQQSLESENFTQ